MDGHHPDAIGVQNSAYRFAHPKFVWYPRVAKGRDEVSALTGASCKVA